jgi:hypothetical protein
MRTQRSSATLRQSKHGAQNHKRQARGPTPIAHPRRWSGCMFAMIRHWVRTVPECRKVRVREGLTRLGPTPGMRTQRSSATLRQSKHGAQNHKRQARGPTPIECRKVRVREGLTRLGLKVAPVHQVSRELPPTPHTPAPTPGMRTQRSSATLRQSKHGAQNHKRQARGSREGGCTGGLIPVASAVDWGRRYGQTGALDFCCSLLSSTQRTYCGGLQNPLAQLEELHRRHSEVLEHGVHVLPNQVQS